MHEWMVDNGFTPHIVVDASRDGVHVPKAHVRDGKIVLNVSPAATRALVLANDVVSFEARFGGAPQQIAVPLPAVLGIYARETGQGMIFSDDGNVPPSPEPSTPPEGGDGRPKLKIVK